MPIFTKRWGLVEGGLALALVGACNGGSTGSATDSGATDSGTTDGGTESAGTTTSSSGNSATGTTASTGTMSNSNSGTTTVSSESDTATMSGSATDNPTTTNGTTTTDGTTTDATTGVLDTGDTTSDITTGDMTTGDITTGDMTTGDMTTGDMTTGDMTTGNMTTGDPPPECGTSLKATVRDFHVAHPDFETYCCGLVKGLVQANLGGNNKPVFAQVGNPKMLTDAPTFDQWYNDVNGVNMPTTIILDLTEIQPGLYSYSNNNFFPIDGQLFGNEGNNHNFHFTTRRLWA